MTTPNDPLPPPAPVTDLPPADTAASGEDIDGELPNVKKAVLTSAAWTTIGFGVMQVFRFVSNIILTWLLLPEAFGLMAFVDVVILGLDQFSDVGINTSVVRSPRGDEPDFLNTAWTLQVIRGAFLWLCATLFAWPAAALYNEPLLLALLPVAGLTALIEGFDSSKRLTLERQLRQGPLVLLQVTTQVVSICCTVAFVYLVQPNVWGLIAGRLVGSFTEVAGSHLLPTRFRNRFHWDRSAFGELMHFGKWIFAGTVFTFLADKSDRLVIGRLESFGMLGVYNLAVQMAGVPRDLMYSLIFKLVFPLYSRMHGEGRALRHVFSRIHPLAAGLTGYMVCGLIGTGPIAIQCIFREAYHGAGWMLQILAVGVWLTMLEAAEDSALFVLGMPRVSALSNAAKAASLPILVTLGWWLGGFVGLIVGFVAADFVRYINTAWFTHRAGMPVFRYDLFLSLYIAAGSTLALLAGQLPLLVERRWERFAAGGVIVTLVWSLLLLYAWRKGMLRTKLREFEEPEEPAPA